MDKQNPLLLTLSIDADAQEYFNALRKLYFPAERNFLDAHLMLFHQLPITEKSIISDIEALVKNHNPFTLQVSGLSSIGNGVAYKVESATLQKLHKRLQSQWMDWLIPQDENKLWPHITIQNKVNAMVAKELLLKLAADFEPFTITGTGLSLWEYQGGPWKFIDTFNFTS